MVNLLPQNDEHCIELDEFFKRLKCSNEGLSSEEALNRQSEYGLNVLEEKEKRSLIVWFGKHLVNFFALLLWTGAALAFISEYLVLFRNTSPNR
jgi:sodium/potassium-transporting ATPase subunit alpha